MTPIQQELRHATILFWAFLDFALAWFAYGWRWLRDVLAGAGLPPVMQTALLLAVLASLVVMVLRMLGGLLRLLLLVAAGLLVARALGAI